MHAKQRKIVVLGYRGVGKTSLVTRHVTGQFPDIYSPTIENNYSTTVITKKRNEYHLQVVDSSGQDELSQIPSMYAINVDGYILVYSVQSADSFNVVQSIYERLVSTGGLAVGRFPVVLVANKVDLKPAPRPRIDLPPWLVGTQCDANVSRPPSQSDVTMDESIPRAVSSQLGRSLAAKWQATYVETSALDNLNVSKVFEQIGERLKDVDDGQYLMSTTGLNHRSSWTRRRRSRSKSGNRKRGVDAWWRKLTCTSSTAVSESHM